MTNAVTTIEKGALTLRDHVSKMKPEFAKALPGHITADRFIRTAQTAIALTRNIERVKSPQSLLAALTKSAADGLILDGREAALVVDYNGDVQYRPMMRGLLKLAYQSGEIKSIVVEFARDADVFSYSPTDIDAPIKHEINMREARGEAYAVYAMAVLKDGGIVHEVMTADDVNRIRDRSDAYKAFKAGKIKSTPWTTDWSEMARKTVFRRLSKYLPSSNDRAAFHQAVERIDEDYGFEQEQDAANDKLAPATTKKRGGAAAKLNAVPSEPEQKEPVTIEHEPLELDNDPEHDPETGEIIDRQDADII